MKFIHLFFEGRAAVCRKEHKPSQIRAENSPLRKKHEEAFTP